MRKPASMKALEELGRVRLSEMGKNCAFNLRWHENPARRIEAYSPHKVLLTKRGIANHEGDHCAEYPGFPELKRY